MKILNSYNLPQPLVDAVKNDPYTKGDADISITGLVGPARVAELTRQHWDEIEEDASDRIWSLLGQACHEILRRANTSGITEERLYMDCLGWKVSGQFDRLEFLPTGVLQDYKVTQIYAVSKPKIEWNCQLNLYNLLLHENGYNVQGAEIVAILKDWKLNEYKEDDTGKYPEKPVKVVPIELWPLDKARKYMEQRVKIHQSAREELPLCSSEERWASKESWALMKEGSKKAIKLFYDKELANAYAKKYGSNYYITWRPPQFRRCADYCSVSKFCEQYNEDLVKIKELKGK